LRAWAILARAFVTAAILSALLLWLPRQELLGALSRTPFGLWALVVVCFLAGHGATALKWRLLLAAAGLRQPVGEALRAHAAGLCANLCLPSIVGGDVVRAGIVIRRRGGAAPVAVGSLADRVIDTTALTLLAALGAVLAPGVLDGLAGRILPLAALGCFATIVGALVAARLFDPRRLPPALARIELPLARLREALGALAARPATAGAALLLSLCVQAGFVALNALLGGALGIALPFSAWLLCWPLAKFAALVPVSLGGIGVREAALAALLAPFAVEPARAVAQSLIWESVLVSGGLAAGAAALLLGARAARGSALREETQ
jgi:uncharacterized membrane protein YbhN (UPF0104 family)